MKWLLIQILLLYAIHVIAIPSQNYQVLYFENQKQNLNYDQIKKISLDSFHKVPRGKAFNQSKFNCEYWFTLLRDSSILWKEALYLFSIRNSNIDTLEAFIEYKDTLAYYKTGDQFPFRQRAWNNRNFIFPMYEDSLGACNIYVKVHRKNSSYYIPLGLQTEGEFYKNEKTRYLNLSIYACLYLFTSVVALFLFIITRQKQYLFYVSYSLSLLLIILDDDGLAFEWIFPNHPVFNNFLWPTSICIACASIINLCRSFLNLSHKNKLADQIGKKLSIIILFLLATIVTCKLFSPLNLTRPFCDFSYYITSAYISIVLLVQIFRKNFDALYFLGSISILLIGSLFFHLNGIGVINSNPFKINGIVMGMTAQIVFLFFAFLFRYGKDLEQKLKLEKEVSLQEAKMVQEKDRIREDLHDELGSEISAIKLQALFHAKKMNDTSIKSILDHIAHDADQLNTNLRNMVWGLNTQNDGTSNFMHYVSHFLTDYFSKTEIELKRNLNIQEPLFMSSVIRINLIMIIKEICHNIVKHSQAKSVQFSMSQEDSRLKIVIHDDGIGISDSSSRGNGLTSIANRVKKINAHITYTNHNGTQYTIVITLTPDMPKS